jgi:hypothetical protein
MKLAIIQQKIFEFRGQNVMLDFDLAELYRVETKRLNQQVKRNIELGRKRTDRVSLMISLSFYSKKLRIPKNHVGL